MSQIYVNFREVKNANGRVPSMIAQMDATKRSLGLMRYRIPEDRMDFNAIRNEISSCVSEIESLKEQLRRIYTTTEQAMFQYENGDKKVEENAKHFH